MAKKPKLALIPSGYKVNKVYSVLPSDGVGDFNFSRSGTATRVNKQGLIETLSSNVPRLNYPLIDGVVSGCPSLLLEPARTNLVPYSEAFDEPDWVNSNSTVTGNQVISPDGTLNADLLETSVAGGGVADTFSGSGDYSFSVFAKYKDIQFIRLRSTNSYAWFDVKNGSVGTTISALDAKIEYYGNGWYRCTLVGNNTNTILQITCTERNGANVGFGSVYLWGAQFEAGSFATSYIKSNDGGTVTRSAETCNGAGDVNTFNDSEGVLFAEISAFEEIPTSNEHIVLRNSASTDFSNSILIQHRNDGALRIYVNGVATGNIQFIVTDINWLVNNKIAIQYNSIGSNYKLFLNGTTKARYSNAVNQSVVGLNDISFYWGSVNNPFYGNTKQIQYFDTALTDTDLEELTSWTSFNEMANAQLYTIL